MHGPSLILGFSLGSFVTLVTVFVARHFSHKSGTGYIVPVVSGNEPLQIKRAIPKPNGKRKPVSHSDEVEFRREQKERQNRGWGWD